MKNMKIFKHSVRFYVLMSLFTVSFIMYANNTFGLADKIIDEIIDPKTDIQYKFIYIDSDTYNTFRYDGETK